MVAILGVIACFTAMVLLIRSPHHVSSLSQFVANIVASQGIQLHFLAHLMAQVSRVLASCMAWLGEPVARCDAEEEALIAIAIAASLAPSEGGGACGASILEKADQGGAASVSSASCRTAEESEPEAAPDPVVAAAAAESVELLSEAPALTGAFRVYAVWRVPESPAVTGVLVAAEPGAWDRVVRVVLKGPFAGSGARLRRATSVWDAEQKYTAEAPRHSLPLTPSYWRV